MAKITPEAKAQLEKKFPASQIKHFTGKGGKLMSYIDVEVIEARIAEVDPDWEKEVQVGARGVAVHYIILGVRRGDMYDNDSESNKYGAPQVNALARASRRAARKFGVGSDLWEEDGEEDDEAKAKSSAKKGAVKLSPKQVNLLKAKGFKDADIARVGSYDIVSAALDMAGKGEKLTPRQVQKLLLEFGAAVDDYDEEDEEDEEDED